MDKNKNPFLNPEWVALQQQYIEALSALNPAFSNPAQQATRHSGQPAWNNALDHWYRTVEPCIPAPGKPVFDNILNQTRTFYTMADDFAGLLQDIAHTDSKTEDWRKVMASHLGRMKVEFDTLAAGKSSGRASSFFPAALLESWKNAAAAMSFLPGQTVENLAQESIEKLVERLAGMPGVGPAREHQDRLAEAMRLWNEYQDRLHEYESMLAGLGKLALDRLEQKILEIAENDGRIDSLRQIYDLWIDANEEVFARFAFYEDHARLYGELVNALMRFRRQFNEIMDTMLAAANMPTGAAMQTVYQRQQDMRRQFSHLQGEIEGLRNSLHKPAASRGRTATKRKKPHKPAS